MRSVMLMMQIFILVALFASPAKVHADQYDSFRRTRYYSANKQYFVEVTKKRRATLYLNSRRPRRLWTCNLSALPARLLVTNNGRRVIAIDRYYGNKSDPRTPVIILLNEKGSEITSYILSEVANLSKVITTTSDAQWFRYVNLSPDDSQLIIQTIIAKRDPSTCLRVNSHEEAEECSMSVPYEKLRFDIATGKLISRENITVH